MIPGPLISDTEREKRGRYFLWVRLFENLTSGYILFQHPWESYTDRRTAQDAFRANAREVVTCVMDYTYDGMVELLDMFESISGVQQSREPLHEDTLKKMVELTN